MTKKSTGRIIQKFDIVVDETAFLPNVDQAAFCGATVPPRMPEQLQALVKRGIAGAAAGKSFAESFDTGEVVGKLNEDDLEALVDASFRAARVRLALKALALFRGHEKAWVQRQYERWRAEFIRLES